MNIHIFTFHYASTLSEGCRGTCTAGNGFTFHYASTLSRIASAIQCCMDSFTFHYASTLSFYAADFFFFHFSFTFNYASTLSISGNRILAIIPEFTFHYASTLSKRLLIRAILIFCIYIPLCFYFIQLPHELHEVPAYDLHSTMLLSRILATFRSCYIQLN